MLENLNPVLHVPVKPRLNRLGLNINNFEWDGQRQLIDKAEIFGEFYFILILIVSLIFLFLSMDEILILAFNDIGCIYHRAISGEVPLKARGHWATVALSYGTQWCAPVTDDQRSNPGPSYLTLNHLNRCFGTDFCICRPITYRYTRLLYSSPCKRGS